jgi:hypothetical protein
MDRLPSDIDELFKSLVRSRRSQLDDELKLIQQGLDICESPIEQMFLIGLIQYWWPTYPKNEGNRLSFHSSLTNFISLDFVSEVLVKIHPQQEIELDAKAFRVDFLLEVSGSRFTPVSTDCWQRDQQNLKIAVEIDGHQYHERTKEQAQRDKSRDRLFSKHGYIVLRYTGSEVYREVYRAVRELAEIIYAKLFSVSNVYDLFYEL